MKDTYYFSHDYNARNDLKMQALLEDHGAVGYGIFWAITEILHEEPEHSLTMDNITFKSIAKQMSTSVEQVKNVIDSCIEYTLFIENGNNTFYSNRVNENIGIRQDISEKRSKAGKISAEKRKNSTSVKQVSTPVQQNPTKDRILKDSIGNNSKGNNNTNNIADKSACYKPCLDVFFKKYELIVGVKPSWSGADGKNLNLLIGKIRKTLEMNKTPATDERIVQAFTVMMDKLPEFHRSKMDIKTINSQYNAIISEIRQSKGGADQVERVLAKIRNEREPVPDN